MTFAPVRGPHLNIAIAFGAEKILWCGGYPMVKKIEDTFIRFDERGRQTPYDGLGRAYA